VLKERYVETSLKLARIFELQKGKVPVILFWFGLDKCQVPTKTAVSLPSSAGQGRGNVMQGSRVETRTGRDHSPITVTDRTD